MTTPTDNSGGDTTLNSVVCWSNSNCTAVGTIGGDTTLAEHWNGSTWTVQSTPNPGYGSNSAQFNDISCGSTSSCMAVGSYDDAFGIGLPLAEHWNGSSWSLLHPILPGVAPDGGAVSAAESFGGMSLCLSCLAQHEAHAFYGYPVDSADGNMYDTSTDLSIPSRGLPLAFMRTYNSMAASTNGPLGYGWVDNLGANLSVSGTTAVLTEENGAQTTFMESSGTWSAPPRDIVTLTHNGDGTWTVVRHAQQTLSFSSSGQLTSMSNLNGDTLTYHYTGGQLTSVSDAAGRQLALVYNGSGLITSVTDANVSPARVVQLEYNDGNGDLTDVINAAGGDTHYVYNSAHQMTGMYSPQCEATPGCPGVRTEYDSSGRISQQADQMGRTTTFSYSGDPTGASGGETTITDPAGNVTDEECEYGILTARTTAVGTPQEATTDYVYDPSSIEPTLVIEPNGNQTQMAYDAAGNMTSKTDPLGRRTAWTYNSLNEPLTEIDPLGVTTTYTYAPKGNLTSVSRPLVGSSPNQTQTTTYTYGDNSHPGDLTAVTDPDGNTWHYTYDQNGNRISTTDPNGNTATSTYNADDWLLSTVSARGKAPGADPGNFTTAYTYDPQGDVLTTTDPLGHTTTDTYDADQNLTSVTDPDGKETRYSYDADDEEVAVHHADGTITTTTYSVAGQVASQVDAAGDTTRYQYDPRGRVSSVADPLGRTTSYGYDLDGLLTRITDPQGRVTTMSYDADNELTGTDYSDGLTPNVRNITYNADGERTGQSDGSGAWSWTWDSLHRLTSVTEGNSGTLSYEYNLDGLPTQITYPDGNHTTRGYDMAGRWTSVTDWLGNTTNFSYDPDGNLTTETLPTGTGVVDKFAFNHADVLSSINDTNGSTTLFSADYARDANEQPTTDSSQPSASNSYGYNSLNQLCYAGPSSGSCASPPTPANAYQYDSARNMTQNAGVTQTYDAAGELTTATPPSVTVANPGNQRGTTGTSVALQIQASDSSHEQLTYRAVGLPAGLTIDPTTGSITGTPTTAGSASVTISAMDTSAAVGSTTFSWTINNPPGPSPTVTVTNPGDQTGAVDQPARLQIHASDSAGAPLGYAATGLPAGLTIDPGTGEIAGTPLRAGVSAVTVTASDPSGATGATKFSWKILAVSTPQLDGPVISIHSVNGRLSSPPYSTKNSSDLILAFISAPRLPRARTVGATITGGGLRWRPLVHSTSTAGYVVLFQARAVRRLKHVRIRVTLHRAHAQVALTIASFDPPAVVAGSTSARGGPGLAHLSTMIRPGAAAWALGVRTATRGPLKPLRGQTRVTQTRLGQSATSWVQRTTPGTVGRLAIGLVGPAARAWALVCAVIERQPPKAYTFRSTRAIRQGLGDLQTAQTSILPTFADGELTYTYDAEGDRTSAAGADGTFGTYGYNQAHELTGFDNGVTYTYNGDGLRMAKTIDGTTMPIAWDETASLPTVVDDGTKKYVYGPGGLALEQISGTTVLWLHHDHLGSTRVVTNNSGQLAATFTYAPYGTPSTATGTAQTNILYAGQYFDPESGLYYLQSRYYDPTTGVFLTVDPDVELTRAPYAYVSGNPLAGSDPSGRHVACDESTSGMPGCPRVASTPASPAPIFGPPAPYGPPAPTPSPSSVAPAASPPPAPDSTPASTITWCDANGSCATFTQGIGTCFALPDGTSGTFDGTSVVDVHSPTPPTPAAFIGPVPTPGLVKTCNVLFGCTIHQAQSCPPGQGPGFAMVPPGIEVYQPCIAPWSDADNYPHGAD